MLKNYLTFDFGKSYFRDVRVIDLIKEKLPVSMSLGIWMTLLTYLIAIPLGVGAGIFLSEYRKARLSYAVRLCVDVLQGVPSIVIGIIVYAWLVLRGGGFSAFSGGVALGIMMLPVVIKATEETLKLVPDHLREASLALGVPYHRTVLKVILPAGIGGIMTGVLVGVARIAGETAPLLFTAFGSLFMSYSIFKPINSLPLLIFNYATSPYPEWHSLAWGASFVLVVLVLGLNLVAKVVTRRWTVQF
jgi:phosphate transport system permease protein